MISVCMAVFNGEQYLHAQLSSILEQLRSSDQLIIVNDLSTDNTLRIINQFHDHRICLFNNKSNLGVVKSFETALQHATGDYIFFSDQDDIWLPGKVDIILSTFLRTNALAVVTDGIVVNEDLDIMHASFFLLRSSGPGIVNNFIRNTFIGCCMAIRRDVIGLILPFPRYVPMHDEWAGLISSICGTVQFVHQPLIMYRRHSQNVTNLHSGSILFIATKRAKMFFCLMLRLPRLLKYILKYKL